MEEQLTCKYCKASITINDYFCPSCGKKIKDKPLSTSMWKIIGVTLVTVLLPPFGLGWAFRYLRQPDQKSKIIGWLMIVLTIISLVYMVKVTIDLVGTVNQAVNTQMQLLQGN